MTLDILNSEIISLCAVCISDRSGGQIALLVIFLISSILNACYFLPIVYRAFFCRPEESLYGGGRQEAPLACLIPLCITALLSVISFFNPGLFIELAGLISNK